MLLSKLVAAPGRGLSRLVSAQVRILGTPATVPPNQFRRGSSTEAPLKRSRKSREFLSGVLFATGIGLGAAWARWGDELSLIPSVKAAQPISGDDAPSSRRKTNNFIADVVKSCSQGVVYIEILDGRYNRFKVCFMCVKIILKFINFQGCF
jgi:hypothetical protein